MSILLMKILLYTVCWFFLLSSVKITTKTDIQHRNSSALTSHQIVQCPTDHRSHCSAGWQEDLCASVANLYQICHEKKAPPIHRWRKYLQLNYKPFNKYLIFEINIFLPWWKICTANAWFIIWINNDSEKWKNWQKNRIRDKDSLQSTALWTRWAVSEKYKRLIIKT